MRLEIGLVLEVPEAPLRVGRVEAQMVPRPGRRQHHLTIRNSGFSQPDFTVGFLSYLGSVVGPGGQHQEAGLLNGAHLPLFPPSTGYSVVSNLVKGKVGELEGAGGFRNHRPEEHHLRALGLIARRRGRWGDGASPAPCAR